MYRRILCPRCRNRKLYRVRRNKKRCFGCSYEFTPWMVKGLRLKKKDWEKIIEWFLLKRSGLWIAERLGLGKNQTYQALKKIRKVISRDVPGIFEGIVEVDETYLGGQKKNKRKSQLLKEGRQGGESKRGFGTNKQPVFEIHCRKGLVWVELVDDVEAPNLVPIIEKKVRQGTKVCSDTWRVYTGLATKGYVHRTVEHGKKEYARGRNHINSLEGFFGYLKRQLALRGGIRRERLPLYLAEYVWRYNNRKLPVKKQINKLLNLVAKI